MLGDGGLGHLEWLGQLCYRGFAGRQAGEDGATGGIGQGGEGGIQRVGIRVCITN